MKTLLVVVQHTEVLSAAILLVGLIVVIYISGWGLLTLPIAIILASYSPSEDKEEVPV